MAVKVSIIIPAYNAGNTIQKCLESLRNLSKNSPEHEIILSNNNSRDSTLEILKKYPEVKVVHELSVQGPAAARNAGLKVAVGEIVAFLDADCLVVPDWLSEGVAPFANPWIAGVAGAIEGITPTTYIQQWMNEQKIFDQEWTLAYADPNIQTGNAFYRRKDVLKIGGFDDRMIVGEDADLSLRILKETKGRFKYNPKALVYHIHHDNVLEFMRQAKKNAMSDAFMAKKWSKQFAKKSWKTSVWECYDVVRWGFRYLFSLLLFKSKDEVIHAKMSFLLRLARKWGMIVAAIQLKQWNQW